MKAKKIISPDESIFKNRDDEAAFWEKNFDKIFAEGKAAKVKFAKNLSESINIRLDANSLNIVREQAREKGLGPTQLIRTWIMEKIGGKHPHISA
jgi:hypothetical protein